VGKHSEQYREDPVFSLPKIAEQEPSLSNEQMDEIIFIMEAGKEINVQSACHLGGCRLEITFSDGHVQNVDFESFLQQAHPELRKYLNEQEFVRFVVEHGNLSWNDHEMCFPIEDLYSGSLIAGESELMKVAEEPESYGEKNEPRIHKNKTRIHQLDLIRENS
jgi:hypothetical protein